MIFFKDLNALHKGKHYCPHFIDRETEEQRYNVFYPRSRRVSMSEPVSPDSLSSVLSTRICCVLLMSILMMLCSTAELYNSVQFSLY